MKRKLCIVIGQLGVGGGERQLYLLLKNLDRTRFEPMVISFNPGAMDYWEDPIKHLKIPLLFIPRHRWPLYRIAKLYQLLRDERPCVLVSWTLHLNFFAGLIGRLLKIHLTIGSIRNDLFNPMKRDRSVHRWFGTKGPDIFIANSTKGKEDLINRLGVKSKKVRVVFNAVLSTDMVTDAGNCREVLRTKFGLPQSGFLLVNIGRLEKSKNQIMLIRVLALLHKRCPDIHAVFVGEGPSTPYLKAKAADCNIGENVHFLGKIPMVAKYLSAFDLLCHSGLADGMPNVLLEGAAAGLPLVTTRVNGAEDIVVDGQTGFVVDYNDDASMANRIERLFDDAVLRETMGMSAKKRAHSSVFSVDQMVKRFEECFCEASPK